jgi:hypothetical protein
MSVLNAALIMGEEASYGSGDAPTRAFEGKADAFRQAPQRIESNGFRYGTQGKRADRVVQVEVGGTGSLELDLMDRGMGMLFKSMFGDSAIAQEGATTAYTQTFNTAAAAPSTSYTLQMQRPVVDGPASGPGSFEAFTHYGVKATGWEISQSVGETASLSIDFDFQSVNTSDAGVFPSYPAANSPFTWANSCVTIDPDGTPIVLDARSFSIAMDLGLKTDRHYVKCSPLKSEPVRTAVPTVTGSIELDFTAAGMDRHAEWLGQDLVDVEFKWAMPADSIESGHAYEFVLRARSVQWTSGTPEASLTELTTQTLEFESLFDTSTLSPLLQATYKSTDTAH